MRMIASSVGLSSGGLPPSRAIRVAARKANTVAPVSRTGLSARLAQVRLVNWLRVDIANCSLKPAKLLLAAFRDCDTEQIHNNHRHKKSNGGAADDCRQNRQCFRLQDIQMSDHANTCRYEQHPQKLKQSIGKDTQIIRQLSPNGEFSVEQDQAGDRRRER